MIIITVEPSLHGALIVEVCWCVCLQKSRECSQGRRSESPDKQSATVGSLWCGVKQNKSRHLQII